jgi:hypothetical protein
MNVTNTTTTQGHPGHPGHRPGHDCCIVAPPFDHLSYLYGQMLTPSHLQRAQQSVYEKFKLHNRCLHGWGVVCGLEVSEAPPEQPCPPAGATYASQARADAQDSGAQDTSGAAAADAASADSRNLRETEIWADCGVALDCWGNDLVVRERMKVDLYSTLSREDRRVVDDGQAHTLWVSLCFKSYGVERVRAAMPDACGTGMGPFYAFQREGVCVRVTLEPPTHTEPCETCCTGCDTECVLLARVDGFRRGLAVGRVDNSVRRPLTRYVPTVISGVGWHHGATYTAGDSDLLLWDQGLRVQFSRPVHTDTLTEGVCDVYVHCRNNQDLWVLDGEIRLGPATGPGMVSGFTYRGQQREHVDPGDRILFVLRADLVLDHCCMPVDGNHVGGLVPAFDLIGPNPRPTSPRKPVACGTWPKRLVPWASGNQVPGGSFESWFFVEDEKKTYSKGSQP